jgi:hypothetical protein
VNLRLGVVVLKWVMPAKKKGKDPTVFRAVWADGVHAGAGLKIQSPPWRRAACPKHRAGRVRVGPAPSPGDFNRLLAGMMQQENHT